VFGAAPHASASEESDEFLHRKFGLAQDALEDRLREVFVVQGNRHAQVALHPMEEPSVAAGRVVNIKAGSLKRVEACSCLDDGESRAHVGVRRLP
jgi:hypothetical protein